MTGTGDRTLLHGLHALWRMARPSQLALIGLVYVLGIAMAAGYGATPEPQEIGRAHV